MQKRTWEWERLPEGDADSVCLIREVGKDGEGRAERGVCGSVMSAWNHK